MNQQDQPVRPNIATDEHGRLISLSDEELRRRAEQAMKALETVGEIGTEEDQRETLEFLAEAFGPERFRLD
jgi:hypothetical protein